jgi:hypothetical protein
MVFLFLNACSLIYLYTHFINKQKLYVQVLKLEYFETSNRSNGEIKNKMKKNRDPKNNNKKLQYST